MRAIFGLMLCTAACTGEVPKPGTDDTGGGGTDTGPVLTYAEREADCSGMDPADPAPLGGWAALTFDDGPDPDVTPQILAVLRKHSVPATFFMLGTHVDNPDNADLIAEIVADPLFEVANHSWDHPNFQTLRLGEARTQIGDTLDALTDQGGAVEFFRFPYGSADCALVDVVREEFGLNVAGWHIDTADWCYAATGGTCGSDDYWRIPMAYQSDMYGWTLDQLAAFDGGVFLYHDIHQYTADEVEDVIVTALSAGYTFTQLSDADAFPLLNAGTPHDFPWIGEACSVSNDTCWQIEYLSHCAPTGDPDQPADAGVCVLDCTSSRCVDRAGTSPLLCAAVTPGTGTCLGYASDFNSLCEDVPGTVAQHVDAHNSSRTARVCLPHAWQ